MSQPFITANSPQELVEALKSDLLRFKSPTGLSRTEIWERIQLDHFLLGIVDSWPFGFPVEINHTSDRNPDFVIATPTQTIGVECSRITNEKIGRLDHLERTGQIQSTVSPSAFLVETADMKTPQVADAALGLGQFYPPKWNTVQAEDEFWFQCGRAILGRKTEAMDRLDYQPCDQYWLVLMDEMSFDNDEIQRRVECLYKRLRNHCPTREKWFSRVVIQNQSLDWQVEVTRDGVSTGGIS